jgi:hypothetical protein
LVGAAAGCLPAEEGKTEREKKEKEDWIELPTVGNKKIKEASG